MGGVESRKQMIERFNKIDPKKWNVVRKQGITQIAADQNGREGQVNYVNLDPRKKPQQELEIYYYRRSYEGPLVKCFGAEAVKSKSIQVCGSTNLMKVITQRITKRWSQLPQLTFPEILYSLSQALHGYSNLYKQVGAFEVTHNMLGVNKQGQLHVWLNQNFAQNNPQFEKGILYTTTSTEQKIQQKVDFQTQMIQDIFRLIEQKCEQGTYPSDFRKQVISNDMNFDDARKDVDDYISEKGIKIPNRLYPEGRNMQTSRSKGMLVTQLANSSAKKQEINISPSVNKNSQKFQIINSTTGIQKINTLINTYKNQPINFETNIGKQPLMTPKNQRNIERKGNQTGGMSDSLSKYNDLRANPNIHATQSIYQPNASPQTDRNNAVSATFGNQQKINSGRVNITYGDAPVVNTTATSSNYINPIPVPISNVSFNKVTTTTPIVTTTTTTNYDNYSIPVTTINTNNTNTTVFKKQATITKISEPIQQYKITQKITPDTTEILNKVTKNQTRITFTTNGSRINPQIPKVEDKTIPVQAIDTSQVTKKF